MFTDDSFDHKVEDLQEMTPYIVYITYSRPQFSATVHACVLNMNLPLVAFMIQSQIFVTLSINPNHQNKGKSVTDAFRQK